MTIPRYIFTRSFGVGLLIMSLHTACGGSEITATKGPSNTCDVKMESRRGRGLFMDKTLPGNYRFDVEMELGCQSKGKHCYQITYLSCQGEVKSDAVPINLLAVGDCPGNPWCLSKCSNANPSMWDLPSLLAIDGCSVYEHKRKSMGDG